MDVGHNEKEANLKGIELLGSNQRVTLERVTLEAYLGNRRAHRK
jgi:hypothetical protein